MLKPCAADLPDAQDAIALAHVDLEGKSCSSRPMTVRARQNRIGFSLSLALLVFVLNVSCLHDSALKPRPGPLRTRQNLFPSADPAKAAIAQDATVKNSAQNSKNKAEKQKLKKNQAKQHVAAPGIHTQTRYISSDAYYYALKGQMAADGGSCKRAVAAFQQALSYDPDSAYLRVASARCLLQQGEIQAAIDQAQRPLKTPGLHRQARLVLAQALLQAHDFPEASSVLKVLLRKKPMQVQSTYLELLAARGLDDEKAVQHLMQKFADQAQQRPEKLTNLGDKLEGRGEAKLALEVYQLALQKDANFAPALRGQRDCSERLGQWQTAWQTAQKMASKTSLASDESRQMLRLCARIRSQKSIKLSTPSCADLPKIVQRQLRQINDAELRLDVARAVFFGGDIHWAQQLLKPLLKSSGRISAPTALFASQIFAQQGKLRQALALLRRVRSASGTEEGEIFLQRARLFWRQLRYAKAISVLRKALQRPNEDLTLSFQLVEFLDRDGQFDLAQTLLDKMSDEVKNSPEYLYHQALLWLDRGQSEQALQLIKKPLLRDPENIQSLMSLALLAAQSGDFASAEGAALQVLAISPQQPAAYNFLAYIWALQGQNLDQAQQYVQRALRRQSQDPAVLDTQAYVLFRQGQAKAAQKILLRVQIMQADDPEILMHLGDVSSALGQAVVARRYWLRALQLKPRSRLLRKRLQKALQQRNGSQK